MTLSEFFDRLEDVLFDTSARKAETPGWSDWLAFRRHAEAREEAGREHWGDEYLFRDNAAEGLEEAADGANYGYFDVERTRVEGGDVDEALQLALIAANHFYEGHRALHALRKKTPPLPVSDGDTP